MTGPGLSVALLALLCALAWEIHRPRTQRAIERFHARHPKMLSFVVCIVIPNAISAAILCAIAYFLTH